MKYITVQENNFTIIVIETTLDHFEDLTAAYREFALYDDQVEVGVVFQQEDGSFVCEGKHPSVFPVERPWKRSAALEWADHVLEQLEFEQEEAAEVVPF